MIINITNAVKEFLEGNVYADGVPVKIFDHTTVGQNTEIIYPSVSFQVQSPIFDETRYISDGTRILAPSSQLESFKGKIGSRRVNSRPHPNPYDIPVLIQVWADRNEDLSTMLQDVLRLFQPRGTISVKDELGQNRNWWMFLEKSAVLDDLAENIDDSRGFRRAFQYVIKGWLEVAPNHIEDRPTISSDVEVNISIKDS